MLAHARQRPHAGHGTAFTASTHAAGGHGLHHLLGLLEAVHELVDGLDRGPRSLGDTAAARAVEDGQVLALGGRHGAHDRLDTVDLALVEVVQGLTHLPHPGHHAQELLHGAHLADLAQLPQEVVKGEGSLGELGGGVLGLLAVHGPLGLLDEGEQVTHVQDARGHTVGVEALEVGQALTGGGEQNRGAGHAAHGQGRAAAGVAVELGEDHAGEADAVAEGDRGVDGVLTDHGVQDEEDLVGGDRIADADRLVHHLGVHTQAAGGVHDDDVVTAGTRVLDAGAGHRHRVAHAVAGLGRPHVHPGALGDDAQLGHGVGALEVGGHQQDALALVAQPASELSGQGGLTGTLETGEHDDRGAAVGPVDLPGLASQDLDELLVDDLDDLLARVEGLGAGGVDRLLAHRCGEGAHHGQGDVSLQEGAADLGDRGVDVGLSETTLAAQLVEGGGDAIGEVAEHAMVLPGAVGRVGRETSGRVREEHPWP